MFFRADCNIKYKINYQTNKKTTQYKADSEVTLRFPPTSLLLISNTVLKREPCYLLKFKTQNYAEVLSKTSLRVSKKQKGIRNKKHKITQKYRDVHFIF